MPSTARFRVEDVNPTPRGWKVRTVISNGHRVRLAFPPGRRQKGSGMVVQVLHPKFDNPCRALNPAELLLMGANPMRQSNLHGGGVYDSLKRDEKLALGRLGIGRAKIRNAADLSRAREILRETQQRIHNRLPNPGAEAAQARELYEDFHESPSEQYTVYHEPHVAAGDYTDLGKLVELQVKPTASGETQQVQLLAFPGQDVRVICSPDGAQLHLVNGGEMLESEIRVFTAAEADHVELGECRGIVYRAVKWHDQAGSARGKSMEWEHRFGDEGGHPPRLLYDRGMRRLLLEGGTYKVIGLGIKN
jgi:hypothetical protein